MRAASAGSRSGNSARASVTSPRRMPSRSGTAAASAPSTSRDPHSSRARAAAAARWAWPRRFARAPRRVPVATHCPRPDTAFRVEHRNHEQRPRRRVLHRDRRAVRREPRCRARRRSRGPGLEVCGRDGRELDAEAPAGMLHRARRAARRSLLSCVRRPSSPVDCDGVDETSGAPAPPRSTARDGRSSDGRERRGS